MYNSSSPYGDEVIVNKYDTQVAENNTSKKGPSFFERNKKTIIGLVLFVLFVLTAIAIWYYKFRGDDSSSPAPAPVRAPAPSPSPSPSCVTSPWSDWGSCSNGKKTRTRKITGNCGNELPTEEQKCQITTEGPSPSPSCVVGEWSDWGGCIKENESETTGKEKRTRTASGNCNVNLEEKRECVLLSSIKPIISLNLNNNNNLFTLTFVKPSVGNFNMYNTYESNDNNTYNLSSSNNILGDRNNKMIGTSTFKKYYKIKTCYNNDNSCSKDSNIILMPSIPVFSENPNIDNGNITCKWKKDNDIIYSLEYKEPNSTSWTTLNNIITVTNDTSMSQGTITANTGGIYKIRLKGEAKNTNNKINYETGATFNTTLTDGTVSDGIIIYSTEYSVTKISSTTSTIYPLKINMLYSYFNIGPERVLKTPRIRLPDGNVDPVGNSADYNVTTKNFYNINTNNYDNRSQFNFTYLVIDFTKEGAQFVDKIEINKNDGITWCRFIYEDNSSDTSLSTFTQSNNPITSTEIDLGNNMRNTTFYGIESKKKTKKVKYIILYRDYFNFNIYEELKVYVFN